MKIYKEHSVCKSQRMLKIFQEPMGSEQLPLVLHSINLKLSDIC